MTIEVLGTPVTVLSQKDEDYISLTDMLKAKDGDFFVSDWLRNRNTVEFLGIWERVHNPNFNYGEFAVMKSQAGLHSYKISVKEWIAKTNAVGLRATAGSMKLPQSERLKHLNEIVIRQMQVLTAAPAALQQLKG